MIGNTQRLKIIAQSIPPITTRASGRELSDPIPWETAAGNNPMAAIIAVIMTGRILLATPSRMDWYSDSSCPFIRLRFSLNTVISNTPSCMHMPNRAMKPMPAEMLK